MYIMYFSESDNLILFIQRTSGEENYSFSEFFTRFGRVNDC